MGIAQTQNSQTPKAISKEYAWVVLDPSRDQDWAQFLGQYAVAIPIHYYPLPSVAHHSLKVQSPLSPPCPNRVKSEVATSLRHVRFTPESRHHPDGRHVPRICIFRFMAHQPGSA